MRLKTSSEELAWIVDREPSLPWRHRVEHGDDLVAEHLTDDDPARVHPQRAADQLGHGDGALALAVGQPLLERDDVGVQLGKWSRPSSSARSTVMRRSSAGISLASARSSVVFPALVAPAIMMFFRAADRGREEGRHARG